MKMLSLQSAPDVQEKLAASIREKREQLKLSRAVLAERSTVPAPTIKKFETTGQISLRQFLLLWQTVADLNNIVSLTKDKPSAPKTIKEVHQQ